MQNDRQNSGTKSAKMRPAKIEQTVGLQKWFNDSIDKHSRKFELETRFVLEFLANSNILNRSFPTNLGSILQRNPVCGQVCKLPRNLSIVRV